MDSLADAGVEWVRDGRGLYRLLRPAIGWPRGLNWWQLTAPVVAIWAGKTLRTSLDGGRWARLYRTVPGQYVVVTARTLWTFDSAFDAVRAVCIEYSLTAGDLVVHEPARQREGRR